jgi:hypothetical protein
MAPLPATLMGIGLTCTGRMAITAIDLIVISVGADVITGRAVTTGIMAVALAGALIMAGEAGMVGADIMAGEEAMAATDTGSSRYKSLTANSPLSRYTA